MRESVRTAEDANAGTRPHAPAEAGVAPAAHWRARRVGRSPGRSRAGERGARTRPERGRCPQLGAIDVGGASFQELVQVEERLEEGALAGAVRAEEEREGGEVDALAGGDAFEVFELEGGY